MLMFLHLFCCIVTELAAVLTREHLQSQMFVLDQKDDITNGSSHPGNHLFTPVSCGRWYCSKKTKNLAITSFLAYVWCSIGYLYIFFVYFCLKKHWVLSQPLSWAEISAVLEELETTNTSHYFKLEQHFCSPRWLCWKRQMMGVSSFIWYILTKYGEQVFF